MKMSISNKVGLVLIGLALALIVAANSGCGRASGEVATGANDLVSQANAKAASSSQGFTCSGTTKKGDEAYGDGKVQEYHDDREGEHGDTLAKFVAIELAETFDPDGSDAEQCEEAIRVMGNAVRELESVVSAFYAKPPESRAV